MSEPEIPDHAATIGALTRAVLDRVLDLNPATTAGEELLSLPKADALLVVLALGDAGELTDKVRGKLIGQILKAAPRRRQRQLLECWTRLTA